MEPYVQLCFHTVMFNHLSDHLFLLLSLYDILFFLHISYLNTKYYLNITLALRLLLVNVF